MTQQYDTTTRFTLFANKRKTTDKHPDRTGTLNVDGVEYFIDGWIKTSKSGDQFLLGSIKRKDQQGQAPRENKTGGSAAALDDSIPFSCEWR